MTIELTETQRQSLFSLLDAAVKYAGLQAAPAAAEIAALLDAAGPNETLPEIVDGD